MVRHGDTVGKIQRLYLMLKLVTTMDVQSGLSVPLKRQDVCCSSSCSLERRETGVVLPHHPLGAGSVVLGREGSSRYSLPSQCCSALGCKRNQELHLPSGRNRNN